MQLLRLKLVNFRNYPEQNLEGMGKVVILVGDNAQGKTNLLEAIHILAITKSFRVRSDADLIGDAQDFARLEAQFSGRGKKRLLEIVIRAQKTAQKYQKVIKLDGKVLPARGILGEFLAVLFCPEDINLIKSVPGERRRFLDILGCQVSSFYCQKLVDYNKVIKNRNRVLLRIKLGEGHAEELIFWNNELVEKGSSIMIFRQKMVAKLNLYAKKYFRQIVAARERQKRFTLRYLPSFQLTADSEEALRLRFRSILLQKEKMEVDRQQTIFGPHRDDLHFFLGTRNIVHHGSRGEFRSAILALKLAEIDFLEEGLGERPILLLDDVFSELDPQRKKNFARLVRGQQTFITTTDLQDIALAVRHGAQEFRVQNGHLIGST